MKIAILSDIHGNAHALAEVLKEIKHLKITRLFILGDIVGYYYSPDKVLQMLASFEVTMIGGNHENMLKEIQGNVIEERKIREKYGSALSASLETLSSNQLEFLTNLPDTIVEKIDNTRMTLCHGSPGQLDQYIYPKARKELFEECMLLAGTEYLLLGHTHYPFIYVSNSGTIMNPGSVGQPRDHGNMASWAVFDSINKSVVNLVLAI